MPFCFVFLTTLKIIIQHDNLQHTAELTEKFPNKQRIVPATAIHVELTGHVRLFQLDINANVKQDMRVAIVKQV